MKSLTFSISDIAAMDLEMCDRTKLYVRYLIAREKDNEQKELLTEFSSKLDERINELKIQKTDTVL